MRYVAIGRGWVKVNIRVPVSVVVVVDSKKSDIMEAEDEGRFV
jgi:hypothetical protein